jgi:hypothetical protein
MPLEKLTLDHMSYFVIGSSMLGMTEYPQIPFIIAKVFLYWVQQNTLIPLLPLQPCRYSYTSPAHLTRQTH